MNQEVKCPGKYFLSFTLALQSNGIFLKLVLINGLLIFLYNGNSLQKKEDREHLHLPFQFLLSLDIFGGLTHLSTFVTKCCIMGSSLTNRLIGTAIIYSYHLNH